MLEDMGYDKGIEIKQNPLLQPIQCLRFQNKG